MDLLKRCLHTLLPLFVIFVTCGPVGAEEPSTANIDSSDQSSNDLSKATEHLETIEVIAEVPSTGDVLHEEFTGSHQRIQQDTLKRRDITVADVLAHESGIQSRQSGGFGTFSSMTIRAASAAQTGVYLDGILLNSGGNSVIDLSMLELLTVDSVDIYRGATPVQFGLGAMGGAINFKSASALENKPSTVALLGVGSFGTERAQLLHRSKHGRYDVVGAFSLQQSENDYSFLDSNGTPLNTSDDVNQLRNNAQVQRTSGMARTGFRWNKNAESGLLLQVTGRELGVPEWRNVENNQAELVSDNVRVQFNHTLNNIGSWNSRHNVYLHNDDEIFDDRLSQIGLGAQHSESKTSVTGYMTYWEHVGSVRTTSINVELRREALRTNDLLNGEFNYRVERDASNISLQSTQYAMADRLLLNTGLSLQSHEDRYDRISRRNQSSRSANILSPRLGLRFDKSTKLSFRGNLGRYYREPSFDEIFRSRGLLQGNDDLVAEEGINADLGFTWKPSSALTIDSALFASWRDELIATVFDARGVGRSINVGKARIVGVELGANWEMSKRLSLRANLTSQDARSLQAFDAFDGKQLPGEAKHSAYLRLQHTHKNIRAFVETDGAWDRFYDQANVLPAKDRWLQNFGVEWERGRWTLSGAVSNITDQNVEDFNGLPRPGRAFTFSITTRL